jgi:hypothetical protein
MTGTDREETFAQLKLSPDAYEEDGPDRIICAPLRSDDTRCTYIMAFQVKREA